MKEGPISPKPVTDAGPDFLPAYLSNGVLGLRVREIPLLNGVAVLNELAAEHRGDPDRVHTARPVSAGG